MKAKKWLLPVCIVVGVIIFSVVGLLLTACIMSSKGYGISVGRFYSTDTCVYLVGEGSAMVMSDQSDDKKLFRSLSSGDLVLVVHDGIEESYPSKTGAHIVFRLSKGDESNLPENLDIGTVQPDDLTAGSCSFNARYIRTDGYIENAEYPAVNIIRSVDQLNAYYEANKSLYDLERRENTVSGLEIGFLDACDKYGEAYFEDQILVMVILQEGSGSIRHNVKRLERSEEALIIEIDSIVPESYTDDMALWHIMIEPEAGVNVKTEADVSVLLGSVSVACSAAADTGETTLEYYITEDVKGADWSDHDEICGWKGAREFLGSGYKKTTAEDGTDLKPTYCVSYMITAYPDYDDGGEYITDIIITDPSAKVHGLTVNSTFEEFNKVFERLGYELSDGNGAIPTRIAEKDGITFRLALPSADNTDSIPELRIHAEVTNRKGIQF